METTTAKRVLVVEDDAAIRELLTLHLKLEGYGVLSSENGTEALRLARTERFDLIVLDVMLPGLDGISVCGAIRRDSANTDVPILMLTARREEADKVLGLETGADDYLTKPFGVREFVARVRALQRRHHRADEQTAQAAPVVAGPLTVDPARRQARLDGREIDLTANEFDLLYLLATSRGIVFSREALMQRIWGHDTHVTERSVDTLVKRLRKKIEDDGEPRFILTVWGAGYKFADLD